MSLLGLLLVSLLVFVYSIYFNGLYVGEDGIFCALLNCLKTQLDVVCKALLTIRLRTLTKLNLPLDYATMHDDDCPELEKALYKELNQCIKHITSLLKYVL